MSLERLSVPTETRLRSTLILTSLPQIVSELLQNALDAHATQIEVGIDCEGWECWVRDNGEGISREGLAVLRSGRYSECRHKPWTKPV
jgi:DNA mismatch repair protein MLH3